ncbi:MAG: substrate-binding domain-containing protein [Thermoguttaceae bacterium]
MPKRPAKWRILALLPDWLYYGREIERGLLEFAERHEEVRLIHGSDTANPVREVRSARPDGIVAFVDSAAAAAYLARQNLTVVHVAAYRRADSRRSVVSDDAAVGRMAAEYLRGRGFGHFAYVGPSGWHFAERRRVAFVDCLRDHGLEALVYDADDLPLQNRQRRVPATAALHRWVCGLPRPAVVFCAVDRLAASVAAVCREERIRVPDDLAILGAGNDDLLCLTTDPPLSSIQIDGRRIGHKAGELLVSLLGGKRQRRAPIEVPPGNVVTRRSTDVLATSDDDLSEALRFIRERAVERISVGDVADHVSISRTGLIKKFRRHLDRSPLEEIRRVRIDRAKQLLAETDLSMLAIADQSGFMQSQSFATVFRKVVGLTPTAYRRQFRSRE